MLSDATILSRWGPRRSSAFGSSTFGSSASSIGVDGGCKSAEPDGSATAIAVAAPPLFNSGDSAAGVSAAGFALVFLVETLGIIKLVGLTGFPLPDRKAVTPWTPDGRKNSKWITSTERSRQCGLNTAREISQST